MNRHTSKMSRYAFRTIAWGLAVGMCLFYSALLDAQMGGGGGGGFGGGQMPEFRGDDDAQRRKNAVPFFGVTDGQTISDVSIKGNVLVPQQQIISLIKSREGRIYDPEQVEMDVRALVGSGLFRNVKIFRRETAAGIALTFEVFERPIVSSVHFVGNDNIKDKALIKEVGIKPGDPLNQFAIDEGRRRIEEYYLGRGYARANVSTIESKDGPTGVAYQIHEGPKQRIRTVSFTGNEFVDGARLKAGAKVQSKPGILWLFGGKVNYDQVDEDVERLNAYYHSFGFFRCRIGRKMSFDEDDEWMNLSFVIDEGPRYRVRSITFDGNQQHPDTRLEQEVSLKQGEYFQLTKMQRDLASLRDLYGGVGYVFNEINPEIKFDREPGVVDLVYNINEGDQYRVGQILVNIDGDESHTRNSVVLNRLTFRPGELIDVRKIRQSETRLASSQLFLYNPAQAAGPKIAVKPVENDTQIARQPETAGDTFRGQSPRVANRPLHPVVHYTDILVTGRFIPRDEMPDGGTETEQSAEGESR